MGVGGRGEGKNGRQGGKRMQEGVEEEEGKEREEGGRGDGRRSGDKEDTSYHPCFPAILSLDHSITQRVFMTRKSLTSH